MLPLQQAREVRDSILEYIRATFKFKEKDVSDAFYRFIENKEDGLFKGPYISLKTPFVSATEEESKNIPLEIAPNFPPYLHQLQAFKQLTMKDGNEPKTHIWWMVCVDNYSLYTSKEYKEFTEQKRIIFKKLDIKVVFCYRSALESILVDLAAKDNLIMNI